jgi:RimJ/RimL family protein N-acetyltransferase
VDNLYRPLFRGELIRLSPFDLDRDTPVELAWYSDTELLALVEREPVRPLTPAAIKKAHTEEAKDTRSYAAAIRTLEDDRLVGRAALKHIDHSMGNGLASLMIGAAADRNRGYGTEALHLLLRYAFDELNLTRLGAEVIEYNAGARRWLERAGFVLEVQQREALYRAGRYWDLLSMGILAQDWQGRMGAGHV